jgi:hypothetical protein
VRVAPAPDPNVSAAGKAPVSVTVRSVLGILPDAEVRPEPDAPRVRVYPAGSLVVAVYACAAVAVAVVPGLAGGKVTVPDNPDSETTSLTDPPAVTELDWPVRQVVAPEAGWKVPAAQAVSLVCPEDAT